MRYLGSPGGVALAIERELKYRLDEVAYEHLKTALGKSQGQELQVNLYLDTPEGGISAAHGALRLRRERETRTLTYKRGLSQTGSFFEILELEAEVDEPLWQALASGLLPELPLEPLERLRQDFPGVKQLVPLGQVQNLRIRYPLPTGDTAELDRTEFPGGGLDYELEVETERPEEVERHLHTLGVILAPQSKTKFRRFLEAVGRARERG